MQALDELVSRWRENPDPEATLALCAHLGTSPRSALLREVGASAETWHRDNAHVMLSVGRMYLDAGLFAEAQTVLVQASRLEATNPEPYRYLGEVLLRRGDAIRCEKVLARCIGLGTRDQDAKLWHERAVVYSGLQKRHGLKAVADEVARTVPLEASIPAPAMSPREASRRETRRSRPPAARPARARRSSPPGPRRRALAGAAAAPGATARQPTLMMGDPELLSAELSAMEERATIANEEPPSSQVQPQPRGELAREAAAAFGRAGPPPLFPQQKAEPEGYEEDDDDSDRKITLSDQPVPAIPHLPASDPAPTAEAPSPLADDDGGEVSAEQVLLVLAQVGLFETQSAVAPAWEAPPRPRPRRIWALGGAVAIALAASFGGLRYVREVQARNQALAQEIGLQVREMLDSASPAELARSEQSLERLFELDSRSREAARLWLENRSEHLLVNGTAREGIEAAIQRARAVGVPEQELAFGMLASALASDDLPAAGRLIQQWNDRAKDDGLFHLMAATVLERAGNAEALDHYGRATRLLPENKLAHALRAHLALLILPADEVHDAVEPALTRLQGSPAADLLVALRAASTPGQEPAKPLSDVARAQLPAPLRATALALDALTASSAPGQDEAANRLFDEAMQASHTPAVSAWIGLRALDSGRVELARKAALAAMKLSALHSSSQALAARIAIAEGRLSSAQEALRGLPPSAAEVLVVEAISAYERLEPDAVVELLANQPENGPVLAALRAAPSITAGSSSIKLAALQQYASQADSWGKVIAIDAALDGGDLEFAREQLSGLSAQSAPVALRLSRLLRYEGKVAEGLEALGPALAEGGGGDRRAAEAVLALVGARRVASAAQLLDGGEVSDELSPWLRALVAAAQGGQKSARRALAGLALPSRRQPLIHQVVALHALAAASEPRARGYYKKLARVHAGHPDVLGAGRLLGLLP